MAQIVRALEQDPCNALIQGMYGMDLYFVRRHDEAIAQFENALRTSPDFPVARCGLLHTFNITGKSDQALAAAKGCFAQYGPEVGDILGRYAAAGYREAMRRVGDLLAVGVRGLYVAPSDVFLAYVHAGQKELALQWLSKSVDARDPNVYGAVRDPFVIDSLDPDPRFIEIVRRTRLPL